MGFLRYRQCTDGSSNLICLLALSGVIAKDMKEFQKVIKAEKSKRDNFYQITHTPSFVWRIPLS